MCRYCGWLLIDSVIATGGLHFDRSQTVATVADTNVLPDLRCPSHRDAV
jgi:hypothetical protein